eukprot:scaffold13215_cov120-Isochrysis_galbana.AAC.3
MTSVMNVCVRLSVGSGHSDAVPVKFKGAPTVNRVWVQNRTVAGRRRVVPTARQVSCKGDARLAAALDDAHPGSVRLQPKNGGFGQLLPHDELGDAAPAVEQPQARALQPLGQPRERPLRYRL